MSWDAIQFCKDYTIPFVPPGFSSTGKVSAGWIGVSCPNPFCERNNRPDYGAFNLWKGYYSCWNCGGHNLVQVVRWFLNVSNHEAQKVVWDYKGRTAILNKLNIKEKKAGKVSKVKLPGGPLKKVHRYYLRDRGFDPKYLEDKYGLTGVLGNPLDQLDKRYRNRIIIPFYSKTGRLLSYQGRDITGEANLRYKACKIEESAKHYKHTLYGIPFANSSRVIVVEGVVDQWRMGDGCVASCGTAVTEQQIRELSRFETIFILFDPEKNAQEHAEKIATKLVSLGREAEVILSDYGTDPGEFPESEVKYIRRELGFV